MPNTQNMDPTLTLRQGLEVFQQQNAPSFSDTAYSERGTAFLRDHDIAHVVFGCDTSLYGEGVVKLWTTFGTTLSFGQVLRGYSDAQAFTLFHGYSVRHILRHVGRLLRAAPRVIYRARQMRRPWPFSNYSAHLDTPLADLRRTFNIRVV